MVFINPITSDRLSLKEGGIVSQDEITIYIFNLTKDNHKRFMEAVENFFGAEGIGSRDFKKKQLFFEDYSGVIFKEAKSYGTVPKNPLTGACLSFVGDSKGVEEQ